MDRFEYLEEKSVGGEMLLSFKARMVEKALTEGLGIISYENEAGVTFTPGFQSEADVVGSFTCHYRKVKTVDSPEQES